jgi:hypothetical protein
MCGDVKAINYIARTTILIHFYLFSTAIHISAIIYGHSQAVPIKLQTEYPPTMPNILNKINHRIPDFFHRA